MENVSITKRERKTVLENFLSLSTLQSINYILPVLVLPYLIRIIGAEKFGLIAFAQALTQYLIIFTDYGFNLSATRKISLCRSDKAKVNSVFSNVMAVKITLTILSLLVIILLVSMVEKFNKDRLVYILSFGAVIGNALFPAWFFQGEEKMKFISIINIIAGMLYAIAIFIFIRKPADYIFVPALNSLFFISTGLAGLCTAFKKFKLKFAIKGFSCIKDELISGWSIFVSVVSVNAYTTTRIFAVGLLTNNVLTGYYAIAERIANAFQTFPLESFSQAIFPRLSSIFARNKKRSFKLMNKLQDSVTFIFILVIPLAILSSPLIVRAICGQKFPEVISALRILLIGVFFVAINVFRVQFLLVCGKTQAYSKVHIKAALIGLPLIFASILYFSYLGAAISTVLIEAGVLIATLKLLRSYEDVL